MGVVFVEIYRTTVKVACCDELNRPLGRIWMIVPKPIFRARAGPTREERLNGKQQINSLHLFRSNPFVQA